MFLLVYNVFERIEVFIYKWPAYRTNASSNDSIENKYVRYFVGPLACFWIDSRLYAVNTLFAVCLCSLFTVIHN